MRFAQLCDRVEAGASEPPEIDTGGLAGTWVNANPETSGVARLLITEAGAKLSLRVYAVGPEGLIDWGETGLAPFAASPSAGAAAGFESFYDFGFAEVRIQAMIMKGLIVLAQFHHFKDGSGRADFFAREYFGLQHGRY